MPWFVSHEPASNFNTMQYYIASILGDKVPKEHINNKVRRLCIAEVRKYVKIELN